MWLPENSLLVDERAYGVVLSNQDIKNLEASSENIEDFEVSLVQYEERSCKILLQECRHIIGKLPVSAYKII